MNPIILYFVDGATFFVGLALVLVAEMLIFRFQKPVVRPVLTVLALVGGIIVAISATPLPIWMYSLWGISALAGLVLGNRLSSSARSCRMAYTALLATTVGLFLAELPCQRKPHLVVKSDATVYVLGDSISAGLGTNERCWPMVLKETTSLRVVNLAQPGATVKSAIIQARGIPKSNAVVIVEIGGNDMLGDTDAICFRAQLELLVSSLLSNNHQVLMLELPLFPFQNAFGMAQRSIAAKHNVAMLPKRYFARALGTRNGTLDGLHLSQEGHNAMAEIIAGIFQKE